jgi:hypothetical protein
MVRLTLQDLRNQRLIVLETLSGSRAYGLETPQSDTDIRGVFILPEDLFFGFDYIEQVCSEKNDIVFYELKKYCQLLAKNNPATLELLFAPPETVLYKDPLLTPITPDKVVSKLCRDAFAGYALSQVKRAKGLNKKIFNPVTGDPPRAIEYCHIVEGEGTVAAETWLARHGMEAERCGLSALPHVRDGYALFYADEGEAEAARLGGLFRAGPASQDVCLSSIPKGMKPRAWLVFNKDDFSRRQREYHEYKQWEKARNQDRYQGTLQHGGGYDAKNMMHTFRLLRMALEIAESGVPLVRRPDRDELLSIKAGQFGYEALMDKARAEIVKIDTGFAACNLPDAPDVAAIEGWAVKIRQAWYAVRRRNPDLILTPL